MEYAEKYKEFYDSLPEDRKAVEKNPNKQKQPLKRKKDLNGALSSNEGDTKPMKKSRQKKNSQTDSVDNKQSEGDETLTNNIQNDDADDFEPAPKKTKKKNEKKHPQPQDDGQSNNNKETTSKIGTSSKSGQSALEKLCNLRKPPE